ncbi:hypothetical protein C8R42DRAFT_722166 [Lentinula raphanica]|nr:hypothetical protein C8R42DRAFT_722166 [Lentinula raphanica]
MSHDLAQEEEEFDEWDSSDGDEAKKCANADAPSEYALPFVNSSHGFDRVIQREEEAIHLREIVNARSSRVFPTVIPVSSARYEPLCYDHQNRSSIGVSLGGWTWRFPESL